ncbi:MAG: SMI1/KNR4 family protein [Legionellales bacterium]|nr:SMI1/KNR4 family protein [Legionellales bacterium]
MILSNNIQRCLNEIENSLLPDKSYFFYSSKYVLGANDIELQKVTNFCRNRFGVSLPEDYLNLLKIKNGFEYSGMRIFGTNEIIKNDQYEILGFIEENRDYAEQFNCQYVVFGQCDCDILIFNIHDRKFYRCDHINLCECYDTFSDMVDDVLHYLF